MLIFAAIARTSNWPNPGPRHGKRGAAHLTALFLAAFVLSIVIMMLMTFTVGADDAYHYDAAGNLLNVRGVKAVITPPMTPGSGPAPIPTCMPTNCLAAGQSLAPGQSRTSLNGIYTLVFQADQNLVLYRPGLQAMWASDTAGSGANTVIMQNTDGNLVIYSPVKAVWASDTTTHPNSNLIVQDDGDVVMYSPTSAKVWRTLSTDIPASPAGLRFGEWLNVNDCRYSADWHYTMILQGDGNLVLYQDGATPIWASNTAGQPAAIAILQWEGNFVIYDAHGVPLWTSNSGGQPPGSKLTVAGDFIEIVRAASFNWQSNVSNAPHFNTKGTQPTCKNVNAG